MEVVLSETKWHLELPKDVWISVQIFHCLWAAAPLSKTGSVAVLAGEGGFLNVKADSCGEKWIWEQ